jgi:hypothetical protein
MNPDPSTTNKLSPLPATRDIKLRTQGLVVVVVLVSCSFITLTLNPGTMHEPETTNPCSKTTKTFPTPHDRPDLASVLYFCLVN